MLHKTVKETDSSFLVPDTICQRFSLEEIRSATQNFNEALVIGRGGFGIVYKGNTNNGSAIVVAIKRLHSSSNQGSPEFQAEVEMLSKIRHFKIESQASNLSSEGVSSDEPGDITYASVPQSPQSPRNQSNSSHLVNLKSFSFSVIKTATRNFRPPAVVGEHIYTSLYKGWIDGQYAPAKPGTGLPIAVKRLNHGHQGHQEWLVKEYQEKDKIGSKPDKNGKRGEAEKSQKQLQSVKKVKLKKIQKEGSEMQTPTSFIRRKKD
nr:protein kinase-like domain-containing protein [Tanacetum cinerariifolium]